MKFIVCRHGMPEGTEYGRRYLGLTDEALSDEGREQAGELGRRISAKIAGKSVKIVSSPLARAYETALAVKDHLGCRSVGTDRRLAEIDMGCWDGRYFSEIMEKYPEEYAARGRDLWNYKVPGGESFAEAGDRFVKAVRGLAECADPGEVTVIVSHHGVICAGLSLMTDISFGEWMSRKIPYAGAVMLDITDGVTTTEGELI